MVTPPLPPLSDDLTFNSPLSEVRAAGLVDSLGDLADATVVDLGCGWGELLLRVLERWPTASGVGVDTDAAAVEHARGAAELRGLSERVHFEVQDAASWSGPPADAVIVIGSSHAWGDTPAAALAGIRAQLKPGGRAVYGEGFWARPPTAEQLTAMPLTRDELGSLADLVDATADAGFTLHELSEASLDEWDHFESRHARGYQRWLTENPDVPDGATVLEWDSAHRRAWLRGWRETMGFAYLTLTR